MCPGGRYARLDVPACAPGDLRPAFDVLDADRDGRISREDLKSFYANAATSERFDDEDIAAMIAAADADKDGFVQYDEFERLLGRAADADKDGFVQYDEFERLLGRAAAGAGCPPAMEDVLRMMDRDGDGKVGFDDLKAYLGWAGMPAADEEIRAMIRVAGGDDGDGCVGLEELAVVLGCSPTNWKASCQTLH